MEINQIKINFTDSDGRVVTFSDFSLTQINYTFDIQSPEKVCNEICFRKDELIKFYKALRSFSQGEAINGFVLQDYDSPSTIELKIINVEEICIVFKLTYPQSVEFSLSLTASDVSSSLPNLKSVLSFVDDKEYEKKISLEHGLDFTH